MSSATLVPPPPAARRGLAGALAYRWSWALLVLVVAVALAIGSIHPAPATRSDRIAYLEGIIKCPVCEDVSIAQSNAQQALNLRAKVVQLVDAGASNARVEQYVVAQFGPDEILRPTSPVIWILPIAAGVVAAVLLGWVLLRHRGAPARLAAGAEDEEIVAAALGDRAAAGGGVASAVRGSVAGPPVVHGAAAGGAIAGRGGARGVDVPDPSPGRGRGVTP